MEVIPKMEVIINPLCAVWFYEITFSKCEKCHLLGDIKTESLNCEENMSTYLVVTVSADCLAPPGTRTSAGTAITSFGYLIIWGWHVKGLDNNFKAFHCIKYLNFTEFPSDRFWLMMPSVYISLMMDWPWVSTKTLYYHIQWRTSTPVHMYSTRSHKLNFGSCHQLQHLLKNLLSSLWYV